jgi:hypothetical protein
MPLYLGAREPSDSGDDPPAGRRSGKAKRYRFAFLPVLRLPCRLCEGTGRLWVADETWPRGRSVRCFPCRGTGVVRPKTSR